MTITFKAIECRSAHEAIQWSEAEGGSAVLLNGKHYVMQRTEAERLAAAGVAFAYLHDYVMTDGAHRIVTVPIN